MLCFHVRPWYPEITGKCERGITFNCKDFETTSAVRFQMRQDGRQTKIVLVLYCQPEMPTDAGKSLQKSSLHRSLLSLDIMIGFCSIEKYGDVGMN